MTGGFPSFETERDMLYQRPAFIGGLFQTCKWTMNCEREALFLLPNESSINKIQTTTSRRDMAGYHSFQSNHLC